MHLPPWDPEQGPDTVGMEYADSMSQDRTAERHLANWVLLASAVGIETFPCPGVHLGYPGMA